MPRFRFFLLLAALASCAGAGADDPGFAGSWGAASMAFHVVHPGGPLRVGLEVARRDPASVRDVLFWQFYDAEERPVARRMERFAEPTRSVLVTELAAAPAGIYQLRYASSGVGVRLDTHGARYGVLACRARLTGVRQGWIYVPEGAREVSVATYAAKATLSDEAGERVLWRSGDEPLRAEPGRVLRLDVAYDHAMSGCAVRGMPGIVCPDPATARAIGGSTVTTPDGRRFAHRFQARMWQWMRERRPPDFAAEPARLADRADEWLADPRHAGLLGITGPLNFVPRILAEQNLDPASPDYGLGTSAAWLGPAYVVDAPCNPYRGNPALRDRIVLQEFAHLLKLTENGTFNGNDWEGYAGVDALGFRKRAAQFGLVAPLLERDLRELWTEGVVRVMDTLGLRRVSCENQTSHWCLDHWLLAEGSGDEVYRELARYFAEGLASPKHNPFMVTGYQQERYGPDATYQGLACAQQAIYYRYSGDENAREGLRRIYDLFNHTVAPEPDGTPRGASSFSHRTSGSWVQRQYSAGVHLMAPFLPEAGVWFPDHDPAEVRARNLDHVRRHLDPSWDDAWFERNTRWYTSYAYHPWLAYFHTYVFPMEVVKRGEWPATREALSFDNRNDEFVFARGRGYYAAMYTGRTSHEWVRKSIKPRPTPAGWERQEGVWVPTTGDAKKNAWTPTQGLCLVWVPGYGNWVLGKGWHVYTTQGTRADLPGGSVAWPDYYSCETAIDAAGRTVRQDLRLFDQPVAVRRELAFADDAFRLDLSLSAEDGFAPNRLVEQFPFLDKEGLVVDCRRGEDWQEAGAPGSALGGVSAARFRNGAGRGVELAFARPVDVSFGAPSRHQGQTMRLFEVDWGGSLRKGETRELRCRIAPLAAD